jgi:hypothetical protein
MRRSSLMPKWCATKGGGPPNLLPQTGKIAGELLERTSIDRDLACANRRRNYRAWSRATLGRGPAAYASWRLLLDDDARSTELAPVRRQ